MSANITPMREHQLRVRVEDLRLAAAGLHALLNSDTPQPRRQELTVAGIRRTLAAAQELARLSGVSWPDAGGMPPLPVHEAASCVGVGL